MAAPRILTLDIETAPMIVETFGLFNQNIGINQIRSPGRVIAFAAKWLDEREVQFYSEFHNGHEQMVIEAHRLMDEADIIIHYNGTRFDLPYLRTEFMKYNLLPPSPVQEIDLLKTVRKVFKLDSNKLQYASVAFGLEGKLQHNGHQLWHDCMAGDPKAWVLMRRYNIQDVKLTEKLYLRLLPWIPNHPHLGVFSEDGLEHCPNCNSTELQKRGYKYTPTVTYQQYVCLNCGKWNRGTKSIVMQRNRGVE